MLGLSVLIVRIAELGVVSFDKALLLSVVDPKLILV